jgi:hypothetical protein
MSMRCNKAQENISLEIDGILPPDATVDLEKHLDGCADCRQYREDLLMGQRMLEATEPHLSENFEWRLQLKLNQTLQAAAGQTDFGWEEEPRNWWPWLRNFGAAASVGLAAVLTIAMLTGPDATSPGRAADQRLLADARPTENDIAAIPTADATDPTRRPAITQRDSRWGNFFTPNTGPRVVSGGGLNRSTTFQPTGSAAGLRDGWSGSDLDDLATIQRLRSENRTLQRMLFVTEQRLRQLQAQLDTTQSDQVDLDVDQE